MQVKVASYLLPRGFEVSFRFDGELHAEWSPRVPTGKVGRQLLPSYREARDQFLTELPPFVGNIMVIE